MNRLCKVSVEFPVCWWIVHEVMLDLGLERSFLECRLKVVDAPQAADICRRQWNGMHVTKAIKYRE